MKPLKTAPQILEYYTAISNWVLWWSKYTAILKAMRHYARVKSDKAYELWYKTAINQMK